MNASTSMDAGIDAIGHPQHERCLVCGSDNERGLKITFHPAEGGWTEAILPADEALQGYPGMMHGGVISLLLDAAMTHCLFARGRAGVTARMETKFRHPVTTDEPVHVRGRMVRSLSPTHHLQAEILQAGRIKATAVGLFVERPELTAQEPIGCFPLPYV